MFRPGKHRYIRVFTLALHTAPFCTINMGQEALASLTFEASIKHYRASLVGGLNPSGIGAPVSYGIIGVAQIGCGCAARLLCGGWVSGL